jgi:serine/threonine protein kinase
LEQEIETKTSLSYRAPEMLDLFRNEAVAGPADVWALGVTLFYVTWLVQPFPDGHLAILNGKFSFPSQRGAINQIVSMMFKQEAASRPLARAVHSLCEQALFTETNGVVIVPPSPRSIPVGISPRVSNPISVKRVVPADAELAAAVKAAEEQYTQPSPPSSAPAPPLTPANNEVLLVEAKKCLADIKGFVCVLCFCYFGV